MNEDSLLAVKIGDTHLLAVADGLGGHAAGEIASRVAIIEIEQSLRLKLTECSFSLALEEAIAKANREICLLSRENPVYAGMGTTLIIALVLQGKAWIANVGDSRAYLVGNDIEQVSKDHSLVQQLVDKRLISVEEAFDHPQKNIVTRTLGLEEEVHPDIYEDVELSGRTLLLCSDGLSDALRDGEIRRLITSSRSLEEACIRLIDMANEKSGADNITVLLARETE